MPSGIHTVVRIRRVDGENVITLPAELEAAGFVADAEVSLQTLEDGSGVSLVPETEQDRKLARMRSLAQRYRGVLDRLERYDAEGGQ